MAYPCPCYQIGVFALKHLIIPDTQCKPGVPDDHLEAAGNYAAHKQPDVIIHLGDHWDMPSLSVYDSNARKVREKRAYLEGPGSDSDIEAGNRGLAKFMAPIQAHNKGRRKKYRPKLIMLRGNHEDRIRRACEEYPWLGKAIGEHHFNDKALGWKVIPYLKPITIDGVAYCHVFTNPMTGKPIGGQAHTRLKTIGFSFTMGHQQVLDYAVRFLANGTEQRALICGAFYQHDEDYKGFQGNAHWRGLVMKHDVRHGRYDPMFVSIDWLRKNYL